MAKQTISRSQLHALENGSLVDFGTDKSKFTKVELKDLQKTLAYLGGIYRLNIADEKNKTVKAGSANSSDRLTVSDVKDLGGTFSVEVLGDEYLKFISQGVDGWGGASKGGKYKFKGKGTPPAMVKSVKDWLERSGNLDRIKNQSSRSSITDAATAQAKSVTFMIKRQGISPKRFLDKAKAMTSKVAEEEFGKALKVDIINNLTA